MTSKIVFSGDGLSMYVTDDDGLVEEYSLPTPFDYRNPSLVPAGSRSAERIKRILWPLRYFLIAVLATLIPLYFSVQMGTTWLSCGLGVFGLLLVQYANQAARWEYDNWKMEVQG